MKKRSLLLMVSLSGLLLFNYPLLSIFNRSEWIGGLPVFPIFLFVAWAVLIAITFLIVRKFNQEQS